jgi:membrane fusion protein (multidrug efflux system)
MKVQQYAAFLLTVSATPFFSACGVGEAKVTVPMAEAGISALPVEVTMPRKQDIFASYNTTGSLVSDTEAPVLARAAGEVVEILVEEGDVVEEGQILARLDGERLRLELRQAKALLEKVGNEYERNLQLQQKSLVSAAAVEGLQFDLASLTASYELKNLAYSYTAIRAPVAGVVSSRTIKLGQHVDVNDSVFRITDKSRLVAYLKIPQSEIAKFSAGHIADVRVDAMPERVFMAAIARISPTIDTSTGTFRATAYLDNQQGLLAPGMFGRFSVAYEKHAAALTVPAVALVLEDSESVVYVVQDGAAVRRPVTTGIEVDGLIEITAGLDENEQVIVTGQGGLRDGSKVLANIPPPQTVTG